MARFYFNQFSIRVCADRMRAGPTKPVAQCRSAKEHTTDVSAPSVRAGLLRRMETNLIRNVGLEAAII